MAKKGQKKNKNAISQLGYDDDMYSSDDEPQYNTQNTGVSREEEDALEESVFGKRATSTSHTWDIASEINKDTGLSDLKDEDLFVVDTGDNADEQDESTQTNVTNIFSSSKRPASRGPLWEDPADTTMDVSLKNVKRRRKLRQSADDDVISADQYEKRLRDQFQRRHQAPDWVDQRRKVLQQRKEDKSHSRNDDENTEQDDDDEIDDMDEILASGKTFSKGSSKQNSSTFLDIDRLRDVGAPSSKRVVSIGFHPHANVLFSATGDRVVSMYHVDGTDNELIHSVRVPELPILNAQFHPSGKSILMAGRRPFLMSVDIETGAVSRSSRGLFNAGLGGFDKQITGGQGSLETFAFNPSGSLLGIAGRNGYVHIADYRDSSTISGSQVVNQVKLNGDAASIDWLSDNMLATLSEKTSEVFIWDIRNTSSARSQCLSRWQDHASFGSRIIKAAPDNHTLAVGSRTGLVNIYDDTLNPDTINSATLERQSKYDVSNLPTSIHTLVFNHDSRLLVEASRDRKDQLRIINVNSGSVYSNWPTSSTPLHKVTCAAFSHSSDYLAVGNERGRVLLYILGAYANRSLLRN